ncbi:unnamed protein product [Litomosoides sigmodontis]|uniref:Uncharacterized protein n=1 Tax=Litomosoides sigmodontis TaxID=42156 RepID=A0A3P6U490_LITSI|nr:unnamed protein product [Litomosoides sigmodontis]
MQAAREHRTRPTFSGTASASIDEEVVAAEASVGTHSSPVAQFSTGKIGRLTLETTFDESDSPQSRFIRSAPFVSSTLPYRQCLFHDFFQHFLWFLKMRIRLKVRVSLSKTSWSNTMINTKRVVLQNLVGAEAVQPGLQKMLPSEAKFARSKSDRFASLRKNLFFKRNDTAVRNSEITVSDDEVRCCILKNKLSASYHERRLSQGERT